MKRNEATEQNEASEQQEFSNLPNQVPNVQWKCKESKGTLKKQQKIPPINKCN